MKATFKAIFYLLCSGFFLASCEKDVPDPTPTVTPVVIHSGFHFWGNSTQNQSGVASQLTAGVWTNMGETVFVRGAVKFDLSTIPANATVTSAKLTLYSALNPLNGDLINANSGSDNSFLIRRIENSWDIASASWINQPVTVSANEVSVPHIAFPFYDVVDVDVTSLVADMRTSGNYGFMIQLQNETLGNIRQFYSGAHADATKHPKLVITYQ